MVPRNGRALREDPLIGRGSVALAAYALLAAIMTYPLVLHFTTHIPGDTGDGQLFLWNMWWMKYSLFNLKASPFSTEYLIYPYETSLVYHTFIISNCLISLPLQAFMSLVTINNLFFFLSFVLTGYGTYMLCIDRGVDPRAAFVAGAIFAFCPNKGAHMAGHLNLTMTMWLPFYMLYFLRAVEARDEWRSSAAAAGLFLGITFLTDYYYFIFLLIFSAAYLLYVLIFARDGFMRSIYRLSVTGIIALPFAIPVLIAVYNDKTVTGARHVVGTAGADYAADILGFFSPSPYNPVIGPLSFFHRLNASSAEAVVYLGFTAFLLACVGAAVALRSGRAAWLWIVVFGVFTLLSMGPYIKILGTVYFSKMPYAFLLELPVFRYMRSPGRFNIPAMLALAVLASFGVDYCLNRFRGRLLKHSWVVFSALVLVESAVIPLPVQDSTIPAVYGRIAADGTAEAVLDVPVFIREGYDSVGIPYLPIMHYQTLHRKKIFSGNVSYLGSRHAIYSYFNLPVIRSVIALQDGVRLTADQVRDEKMAAADFAALFGVRYVVVHKMPETAGAHDFLRYLLNMKPIYEDDSLAAYEVSLPDRRDYTVDCGDVGSTPYLFRGWINGQVAEGRNYAYIAGGESVLLLNLGDGRGYEISALMRPTPSSDRRSASFILNGSPLEAFPLADGWAEYTVRIGPGEARRGIDRLSIRISGRPSPVAVQEARWSSRTIAGEYSIAKIGTYQLAVADWEQDNLKHLGGGASAAVDYVRVREIR